MLHKISKIINICNNENIVKSIQRDSSMKMNLSYLSQISGAIVSVFAGYFIYQLHEYASLTPDNVCGSAATLLAMGVITCGIGWFVWQFLNFSNRGQVIIVS